MQDPTVPPPGDQWPSDPPPTPRQDHAVLAWLALEADLPDAAQRLLVDALMAWAPVMGPHLFPTEPEAEWTATSGRWSRRSGGAAASKRSTRRGRRRWL